MQSDQFEKFHFSDNQSDSDSTELAYFDSKKGWVSGRMVGEARFNHKGTDYKIIVKPRFGEIHLFRMLSEIFNVRFTATESEYDTSTDEHVLIRRLISFFWLNLLAKGNRYGLPRISKEEKYYGDRIRGRLKVRDSLISMKTDGKVHSAFKKKSLDETVAKLLKLSYQILESKYFLSEIHQPKNATYAIQKINAFHSKNIWVTKQEYQEIQYKEVYKTYKPVIDLSWAIIQNENVQGKDDGKISPVSYFIDMAEIWELYVKSLLKKEFSKTGWQLVSNEYQTYNTPLLKRVLNPDIVFKKGSQLLVFDAKYKLMRGIKIDIDRTDYFQIHTYIHYLKQEYDVIAGGLIYPFSVPLNLKLENDTRSYSLFGRGVSDTKYCIDGIDLSFMNDNMSDEQLEQEFETAEQDFVKRINKFINNRSFKKIA
jgi:5-methylcytosine-specific restriction endonuclease McrBC regulatory subunit McrC